MLVKIKREKKIITTTEVVSSTAKSMGTSIDVIQKYLTTWGVEQKLCQKILWEFSPTNLYFL